MKKKILVKIFRLTSSSISSTSRRRRVTCTTDRSAGNSHICLHPISSSTTPLIHPWVPTGLRRLGSLTLTLLNPHYPILPNSRVTKLISTSIWCFMRGPEVGVFSLMVQIVIFILTVICAQDKLLSIVFLFGDNFSINGEFLVDTTE